MDFVAQFHPVEINARLIKWRRNAIPHQKLFAKKSGILRIICIRRQLRWLILRCVWPVGFNNTSFRIWSFCHPLELFPTHRLLSNQYVTLFDNYTAYWSWSELLLYIHCWMALILIYLETINWHFRFRFLI